MVAMYGFRNKMSAALAIVAVALGCCASAPTPPKAVGSLDVDPVAARALLPVAPRSVAYKVRTSHNVNLRKSARTASKSLGMVPKHTSLKAVGLATNGWYKVSYRGKDGYISSAYATKVATEKSPTFGTSAVLGEGNKLSAGFKPKLSSLPNSSKKLRTDAAAAFKQLNAEARGKGVRLKIVSGYRSYDSQKAELAKYTRLYGAQYARKVVALPGLSEHQTGLAVDLGGVRGECQERTCFARTREGRWLAANAHRYGFILRYPKGMERLTGYYFEPWHYRYVGTAVSKAMKTQKIATLEQFNKRVGGPAR